MPKSSQEVVSAHDQSAIGLIKLELWSCNRASIPALGGYSESLMVFSPQYLPLILLILLIIYHKNHHFLNIDNLPAANNGHLALLAGGDLK